MSILEQFQLHSRFVDACTSLLELPSIKELIPFYLALKKVSVVCADIELVLRTQMNRFGKQLPNVLLIQIFSFLDPRSSYCDRVVCRSWFHTLSSEFMEKRMGNWIRQHKIPITLAFPVAKRLFFSNHLNVVKNVIIFLSKSVCEKRGSIEAVLQLRLVERCIELLSHTDTFIVSETLRLLINLASEGQKETQMLLDSAPHLLPTISSLLMNSKTKIIALALWFLSNITGGNYSQIQAVMDTNLIRPVVDLLGSPRLKISQESTWVMHNLIDGGTDSQIRQVADDKLCKALISNLSIPSLSEFSLKMLTRILAVRSNKQPKCIALGLVSQLQNLVKVSTNPDVLEKAQELLIKLG
jgi:hypothetical protein